MATIQFKDVSRVFKRDGKDFLILDNIQLMVQDQEFVAIVGPSGCGKTTCMRMAAGLEFPSTGTVQVNDVVVTEPGPDRAVVFQQFALFPWKTVHDNIDFGLRSKGIEKDERERLIAHYIALMNLKGYENAYPHQLSGGMQQRVAIARAYALNPQVLLARKNPRTVLFITHAVEEAVYLADRVVVMTSRPGKIKEILDVKSVREAEQWDRHSKIEDVMDLESFVHLRTRIWKSLREEHAGTDH
jgi:NitT/TauT family transport system ATP-binding protein